MLPIEPVPLPSGAPLTQGAPGTSLPACADSAPPEDAGSSPCRLPASQPVQNTVLDRTPEAERGVLAALAVRGWARGGVRWRGAPGGGGYSPLDCVKRVKLARASAPHEGAGGQFAVQAVDDAIALLGRRARSGQPPRNRSRIPRVGPASSQDESPSR